MLTLIQNINLVDATLFLLPIVTGFGSTLFCKINQNSGSMVVFRPPSYVFGLTWTVLYLMLGYSWVLSNRENVYSSIPYGILIGLLSSWTIVYACQNLKKVGVWIIALSILASFYCYTIAPIMSKYLILPLIVWLIFAMNLNMFDVQLLQSTNSLNLPLY